MSGATAPAVRHWIGVYGLRPPGQRESRCESHHARVCWPAAGESALLEAAGGTSQGRTRPSRLGYACACLNRRARHAAHAQFQGLVSAAPSNPRPWHPGRNRPCPAVAGVEQNCQPGRPSGLSGRLTDGRMRSESSARAPFARNSYHCRAFTLRLLTGAAPQTRGRLGNPAHPSTHAWGMVLRPSTVRRSPILVTVSTAVDFNGAVRGPYREENHLPTELMARIRSGSRMYALPDHAQDTRDRRIVGSHGRAGDAS